MWPTSKAGYGKIGHLGFSIGLQGLQEQAKAINAALIKTLLPKGLERASIRFYFLCEAYNMPFLFITWHYTRGVSLPPGNLLRTGVIIHHDQTLVLLGDQNPCAHAMSSVSDIVIIQDTTFIMALFRPIPLFFSFQDIFLED